jgi:hypothetical protein
MRISSDQASPDYHEVVHFIQRVTVNGVPHSNVVSVDIEAEEALCYSLPLTVENGMVKAHIIKGKIGIDWRMPVHSPNGLLGGGQNALLNNLYHDWQSRELKRKDITDVEPKTPSPN